MTHEDKLFFEELLDTKLKKVREGLEMSFDGRFKKVELSFDDRFKKAESSFDKKLETIKRGIELSLDKKIDVKLGVFGEKLQKIILKRVDEKIDTLALSIAKGFQETNERFDKLEDKLSIVKDKVESLEIREDNLERQVLKLKEAFS